MNIAFQAMTIMYHHEQTNNSNNAFVKLKNIKIIVFTTKTHFDAIGSHHI
mgnify:CR=1